MKLCIYQHFQLKKEIVKFAIYKDTKRELKVKSYCSAPQCNAYIFTVQLTKTALPFGTAKIIIADYMQA